MSSISITLSALNDWEEAWLIDHEHADLDDANCVYKHVEGRMNLMRCCGEDCPTNLAPFVVQASDKPYVTIHDFVLAVHLTHGSPLGYIGVHEHLRRPTSAGRDSADGRPPRY